MVQSSCPHLRGSNRTYGPSRCRRAQVPFPLDSPADISRREAAGWQRHLERTFLCTATYRWPGDRFLMMQRRELVTTKAWMALPVGCAMAASGPCDGAPRSSPTGTVSGRGRVAGYTTSSRAPGSPSGSSTCSDGCRYNIPELGSWRRSTRCTALACWCCFTGARGSWWL
jgi:hypothetical protein